MPSKPQPPPGAPAADDAKGGVLGRFKRAPGPATPAGPDIDPVSGTKTRASLHDDVQAAIDRSRPSSTRAVVAFVDIGLLRDVNDSYGADAGDRLLRLVGERLQTIDLPNTQVLRYEGAEFAVVFERIAHHEAAEEVARFLIELLTEPFDVGDEVITISPVVGAAVSADNYANLADFIRDAHQELIRAREQGPFGWSVHDESKRGRYETRIDESRLRKALDNEEFLLAYQPIVRLDNGQMIGVEALLRWRSAAATNTGMLFPHDFMPLLEKSGLSVKVGRWAVEEACRQAAEWNTSFPDRPAMFITVNLGARQLAASDFRDHVVRAITGSGVQPWQLCLDITESALRFNRNSAWTALRELKDMGVKLGLDDFGTGVSSLMYLHEFTLDIIRIDRVFVSGLVMSKEDRAIVKHITGLAHELGLVAIAEGVENQEQADILRKLGVDLAQGYHFGRPEMADGILHRLDPDAPVASDWDPSAVTDY